MIILLMMDKKTILRNIYNNRVREDVENNFKNLFEGEENIKDALFYALCLDEDLEPTFEYNKRMRPFLILLGSNAAELEQDNIFGELATVVELIHQSTLPVDDIQDNSDIRCGRDALWKKEGISTTVNLSLLLMGSGPTQFAKILLNKCGLWRGYPDFLETSLKNLINGQQLDLKADKLGRLIEDYFKIADGKTGALINLALHFGTMPYEYLYSQEKSKALTKFSMIFSRLYQIIDDLKDIKDVENGEEGAKLDSSNIYFYLKENHENLSKLCGDLKKGLNRTHNKLKKLGVIKNDKILDVINQIIPDSYF